MSASTFTEKRFGDIARVIPGYAFKSDDFGNQGFAVVKISEITPPRVELTNCQRISPDKVVGLDRYKLAQNDILIAMTGATLGKVGRLKENVVAYVNQRVAKIDSIESVSDKDFLYYLVTENTNNSQIVELGLGSAQANFSGRDLENLQFVAPDLFTQHRIAAILSSLDDKVELNRQTNATLEATGQAIFKEWFVEFRFPGSTSLTTGGATGEMVESELGMIPRGWRVGSIEDVLKLSNEPITPGTDPNKKFFHFSIPAFDNGRIPAVEQAASILSNKFRVKNNSILVSKLNPRIPRIWPVGEVDEDRSICSTEFQVLLPIKKYFYAFSLNLFSQSSIIEEMKGRASGTSGSHQRIRPQDILDIKTIIPDDEIMIQFEKVVGTYSHYLSVNQTESVALSQTRDNLLPKLMSGEIEV
jgi:type I restriction enzyme S subunit